MAKITLLPTPERSANASSVRLLQEALAEAEAGDITQVALIVDGKTKIGWRTSETVDVNALIGMLERAKCEIILSLNDLENEESPAG